MTTRRRGAARRAAEPVPGDTPRAGRIGGCDRHPPGARARCGAAVTKGSGVVNLAGPERFCFKALGGPVDTNEASGFLHTRLPLRGTVRGALLTKGCPGRSGGAVPRRGSGSGVWVIRSDMRSAGCGSPAGGTAGIAGRGSPAGQSRAAAAPGRTARQSGTLQSDPRSCRNGCRLPSSGRNPW